MIQRYTVRRIAVDYYETTVDELIGGNNAWSRLSSFTYALPCRADYPPAALKNHPWNSLRKDGDSYHFYACVYYFPDPRLAGKWKDYTTAYGFDQH